MFGMPDGDGTLKQRLAALEAMSPEDQQKLIAAAMAPERMRAADADAAGNQQTYRRQMEQAQQMAFTPVQAQGHTPIAQGANLMANALRMFGGLALSGMRERDLKSAQEEAARVRGDHLKSMEEAAGIGMNNERSGLRKYLDPTAQALTYGYQGPYR